MLSPTLGVSSIITDAYKSLQGFCFTDEGEKLREETLPKVSQQSGRYNKDPHGSVSKTQASIAY